MQWCLRLNLNFPNRWEGNTCIHCRKIETDQHLFTCVGNIGMDIYLNIDIGKLNRNAEVLQKIYDRLQTMKEAEKWLHFNVVHVFT